ncbi:MAG: hypothetical protein KKA73_19370 [Chloroflexi bacterium]|nr:hypothetical protein [Chloroflexota bacterium]MBU1749847.1 hypothetical protein [Chloroflexota bacterium]MBU1878212.1 hypothetical protein [Chloroflexota bacterium]
MPTIYRVIPAAPDEVVGWIDQEDGSIYDGAPGGEERYLGQIDYEEGEIYDDAEEFMGWVEDDGQVIASYDDEIEENLGHVDPDGKLYVYDGEGEIQVGQVEDMTDIVEGAAALLFFFDTAA